MVPGIDNDPDDFQKKKKNASSCYFVDCMIISCNSFSLNYFVFGGDHKVGVYCITNK